MNEKYTINFKCSKTVNVPINKSSCGTKPIKLPTSSAFTSFPFILIVPVTWKFLGVRKLSVFNKVVFPLPLDFK